MDGLLVMGIFLYIVYRIRRKETGLKVENWGRRGYVDLRPRYDLGDGGR